MALAYADEWAGEGGYARLNKVRNQWPQSSDEVPCLIIYPKSINDITVNDLNLVSLQLEEIKAYHEVYKIGINLPIIK